LILIEKIMIYLIYIYIKIDHNRAHLGIFKLMPTLLKMGIIEFKNGDYIIKEVNTNG